MWIKFWLRSIKAKLTWNVTIVSCFSCFKCLGAVLQQSIYTFLLRQKFCDQINAHSLCTKKNSVEARIQAKIAWNSLNASFQALIKR